MSNIVVFSKSARKSFSALTLDKALSAILPDVTFADDSAKIKASALHMTDEMVRSSLGASLNPVGFANSAAYVLCRFAYGSKINTLLDGTSDAPSHAIAAAASQIKFGAGVTVSELKSAVRMAFGNLLALPQVKPKVELTEVEKAEKETLANEVKAAVKAANDVVITIDDVLAYCIDNRCADNVEKYEQQASQRAADRAEKHIQAIAAIESDKPFFVTSFKVIKDTDQDMALAMLRDLAASIGYKLSKMPTQKAA